MLFRFFFLVPFIIAGDPRTIKYNPKSGLKKFDYKFGPMAMFDRMVSFTVKNLGLAWMPELDIFRLLRKKVR